MLLKGASMTLPRLKTVTRTQGNNKAFKEGAEDYLPSLSGWEGGLAPAPSVFFRSLMWTC